MIIFVHIAKTAGTSFNRMIEDNFDNKFISVRELDDYSKSIKSIYDVYNDGEKISIGHDYCQGHFGHGIHEVFNCDYKYITFLRNPVNRTVSAIRFSASRLNTDNYHDFNQGLFGDNLFSIGYYEKYLPFEKKTGPDKFVKYLLDNDIICNQMTKQLSGLVNIENISLSKGLMDYGLWFPPYFRTINPYSEAEMEEMLDAAIKNVEKYDFIGIQEDMKGSLNRFKNTFPNLKIKKVNGRFRSSVEKYFRVNKRILGEIRKMNKYDIMLYEHFKDKL